MCGTGSRKFLLLFLLEGDLFLCIIKGSILMSSTVIIDGSLPRRLHTNPRQSWFYEPMVTGADR